MPVTENRLCHWITHLATNVTPKTIRVYMYAMRSMCVDGGTSLSFQNMHILSRVYQGIMKTHGVKSTRPRLPITFGILRSMYNYLDMQLHDDRVIWAAFTLAVSNMLRVSEFAVTRFNQFPAPITRADIDMNKSSSFYLLSIKKSKTDQYGVGRQVHVWATNDVTCPHRAMQRLSFMCPSHVRVSPRDAIFQLSSNLPLSRQVVESRLRSLVRGIGLNPSDYNTHSLRRGGATSYSLANVPDRMIQMIGGWTSDAYKLYIDTSSDQIRTATLSASRIQGWFGDLNMPAALAQQRSVPDIQLFA